MIDCTAQQLETIKRILSGIVPGNQAIVFGSRCSGRAKPYSDLDLVIKGTAPIAPKVLSELIDAFQESDLPFRVDLIDWNTITEEFQHVILNSPHEPLTDRSIPK